MYFCPQLSSGSYTFFLLSSCFCHGDELCKACLKSEVKGLDCVVSGLCGTSVSQCHLSWLLS